MKKGTLKPLECTKYDTPLGYFDAYYGYHQCKGYATNFYKALEATIINIMEQGRYKIDENLAKRGGTINMVTIDKEVCASLRRGCPCNVPNLVTTEQVFHLILRSIV